jgi:molecular chaperone GrpE
MNGKRDPNQNRPAKPDPDDEGGSIPIDPELEAALREATESVAEPRAAAPRGPRSGPGILESEPVSEEQAEAVVSRMREELADTQDRLLRLQAEFENFRKRALRERQEAVQYGSQNLFKDLVSVVDNLERAIAHARESGGGDLASFLQGVELVQRELLGIFEKNHVTEIEALGKPFDPSLHEAMAQVESGAVPPNTVIDVLQKGFQLRDRLVRPSRVIVAKAADGSGRSGGGDSVG